MAYDRDIWNEYKKSNTELKSKLVDIYNEKIDELDKLSQENTELQYTILDEIEKDGQISKETEMKFNRITDIASTSASPLGNRIILNARQKVRAALHPKYPREFPHPIKILAAFTLYFDSFDEAVSLHVVAWDKWLMQEYKDIHKEQMESLEDILKRINQAKMKEPKYKVVKFE